MAMTMAMSETNEPNHTTRPAGAPAPGARGRPAATDVPAGAGDGAPGVPTGQPANVPRDVRALAQSGLDAMAKAGTLSASSVGDALESRGRSLARRVVTAASTTDAELADRRRLERALAEKPRAAALGNATTAAMAVKLVSKFRRLSFFARKTPGFVVAAAVPAVIASVTRGSDELAMVASHLVHRARAEGVEPDLERVRRAAVQIVAGRVVDPETEPGHGPLVVQWMRRAVRAALPFGAGVATADPKGLAAAAAAVDATTLGAI
jgi:hypothetical protein